MAGLIQHADGSSTWVSDKVAIRIRPPEQWLVEDVINNLIGKHDCRIDWWQRLDMLLTDKKYKEALSLLRGNCYDDDFNEQVEIVARTIAEYTRKVQIVP